MNFNYKFEKVLALREREKEEAAISYENAIKNFEKVAEQLYNLLKKKELIEEEQLNKIQLGLSIQEIRLHQQYLLNLQKEIDYYQQAVVRARQQMQYEEQRLTDKNIEVKKYEKLKSREYDKYLDLLNYEDAKVMDEISTQAISRGRFKSQ